MNIVIPDKIEFSASQLDQLKQLNVTVFDDLPDSEAEIASRIKDAELITANYIDITPSLIDAAPKLKYILAPAVGYDWVDSKYAASKGIKVINCPTFNSQAVAELALAMTMAISRKVVQASNDLQQGGWGPQVFVGTELAGRTMGLIGHGNIGKRIDQTATTLGITVRYVDSKSTEDEIDELIAGVDYLVLCVQLNDKTRHMVNGRRLALMKSSAYLVNVARGAIIEQAALINVLREKKIRGAALDVFDGEPLTGVPSDEIIELSKLANVVATPHIGASTEEAHQRLGEEVIENIKAVLDGEPQNVVVQ